MVNWSSADLVLLQSLLPASLLQALRQPTPPLEALSDGCARLAAALAAMTPFVPSPVLDLHLTQPERGHVPGLALTGTVVSGDLTGFTALTSHLATTGRAGNEAISAIVNELFAALVAEVYAHGGGVVQFSGDGLTAFFDAARLGPDHAPLAAAAALAMQARMGEFAAVPTPRGPVALQLRVAVHSGTLFAAEVGDPRHTELVVTGRVLNHALVAEDHAAPGEVLVSAQALALLDGAVGQPRSAGWYLLQGLREAPPQPAATGPAWTPGPPSVDTMEALLDRISAIQPFVPHALPERFLRANAEGGEFRPVTVVFAGFYAFKRLLALLESPALHDLDPTLVGRVLNIYYIQAQAVVHRYGGSINKLDMASFGNRLLALFGAPLAYEDDPQRAVQAAMALRSAMGDADAEVAALLHEWSTLHPDQRLLLQVVGGTPHQRIGIAGGTVFAGIIGTPQRHEYTVMGQTVNMAARLLSAARPGEIRLTSRTYRAVRPILEAELLPPEPLKGLAQPVPMFRAVRERGPADSVRRAAPMVGRAREMIHLRALITRALESPTPSGQVVALVGDAGMGKTRLADEALQELRTTYPAALCLRDSCQSYEQALSYAPVVRLLRQMLTLTPTDDPADQALMVQQQLADLVPDWSRFAPLLGPLLGLPLPDTALTAALTAEQRRDLLHDLVVRLCVALAVRRPLVLVLDDLQWADASTQALVAQLATATAGQPMLLVLIYRPLPGLPEPWRDQTHTTVIRLGELSRADSETLLRVLLNADPPPELLPFIERADGSPFFIEETLRYLLGSGALVRDDHNRWVCTRPLDLGAVPGQVEQLITARLDRLDQETRALAQLAAVIGPRFSERLLAAMTRDRHLLKLHLEELVQSGFLVREEGASPPAYHFKHVLVHEVVYGSLLFARRRTLHAEVAAAIAQVYGGDLDAHRAVLAQHYRDAGQWEPAFTHFIAAAGQAQARDAHSEALALYHEALAVAPWRDRDLTTSDLGDATLVYENLGQVLIAMGDHTGARAAYERLLALRETETPAEQPAHQAALQRKVGQSYEHQGDFAQALIWYARAEQTLAAVAPSVAPLERARVLSDSGWIHFRQGNLEQARGCLEQALDHVGVAAYDEQARILNRLGGVAWARGDLLPAQHYVQRSLDACEHSGDLLGQANALNNLGLITERQGHAATAVRYGMQAMELYERIGNRRMLAVSANNVGYALYNNDQYAQARDYLTQALDRASEVHDTYHQMIARLNLGRVLTTLRQWDGAEASLQASLALAVELNLPAPQLEAQVALGTLALQQGDLTAAQAAHAAALPLATDPTGEEYGRFQRFAARLALAQGDPAEARRMLTTNEMLFIRLHNLPEAARTRKLLHALTDVPASALSDLPLGLDDPGSSLYPA